MKTTLLSAPAFRTALRFSPLFIGLAALWLALTSGTTPNSNQLNASVFKSYKGLTTVLPDFDFDAKCSIVSYQVIYTPLREDPVVVENTGADFQAKTRDVVNRAQRGDSYTFSDIKARCPGDQASRIIAPLAVQIK